MLRLPIERVPTDPPVPGLMEPLLMVTLELIAEPVPEKAPPDTVIGPFPALVPERSSEPLVMAVTPL